VYTYIRLGAIRNLHVRVVNRRLIAALSLSAAVTAAACSRGTDRRAAPSSAGDVVALNNRGVGLMGQFDYGKAREAFALAANASPARLDVQINLAIATLNRQREGDDAEARTMLERVLAADPQNAKAHYCLGLLLLNAGRAADALPHFTFAADRDPADAYAQYYVGRSRFQQNDYAGAVRAFEAARRLNPHLRSAAYGAFQASQRLGRAADADRLLRAFRDLETNPQSEVVEFKYTRMGPLSQAATIDQPAPRPQPRPSGPVFEPVPVALGSPADAIAWRRFDAAQPASITAADIDGDGLIDLFIAGAIDDQGATRNAVWINRGGGTFALEPAHPLARVTGVTAALWGDVDNDGLTDVYLCRRGSNQLWRQTAKGRWSDITSSSQAGGSGGTTIDGVMFDADHDGDLDLLLVKSTGADQLLNNNGDGTFRPIGSTIGLAVDRRPSTSVLVADLDADRDADIIVFRTAAPHDAWINDRTWRYHHDAAFGRLVAAPVRAAVAGDLDADGRIEIYTSGDRIERWTRSADGSWTPLAITGAERLAGATQLDLADVDGDGHLDLVGAGSDGALQALAISPDGGATPLWAAQDRPVAGWTLATLDAAHGPAIVAMPSGSGGAPLVWRPGSGRFPYVTIALTGRDSTSTQIRSNASAIGTTIAARADSRWTAVTSYRSQSGGGQSLQPVAIGTGGQPQIDFVALTWSDGVFQTELALAPGPVHAIAETERQLSSCPVLFAFDGRHFAFVTDLLGVGGLGTPTSPGVYDRPRPRESVLLPDGLIAPRGDRYELKITEPMEEVAYVDAVRLVAYDVPPGWQLVLDERKALSDPDATGQPRFYRSESLPVRAVDDEGRDVTGALTRADGVAAPPGRIDPRFIGRTAEHVLTLRFDRPLDEEAGAPMLVADGWIEYPYAQTLFAAWQANAPYRAPTVEARGADGQWRLLRREFGYPAGMPRRMSLPLGALPHGTKEIRLRTTQEIYWDRIAVAFAAPCPLASAQPLPLAAATLAKTGFAHRDTGPGRHPSYNYDRRVPIWDARHPRGEYTREGDVRDLIGMSDNAVAIFGPGEELHLEFAASQAALRPGWTRRFVLEARGWCKDMDLYTRDGDTVAPVPGTRSAAAEQLQRQYTTRYESGR
jgi:tetratricopeptide (TPR) repeat protein